MGFGLRCLHNVLSLVSVLQMSALYLAAKQQDLSTAKILIAYNSSLDHVINFMSPLCASLQNSDRLMAYLLIEAGFDVTNDKEARDMLSHDVPSSANQEGESLTVEDWVYFNEVASRPPFLLVLCRNCIRRTVGRHLQRHVQCLPLPAALKSNILLESLAR